MNDYSRGCHWLPTRSGPNSNYQPRSEKYSRTDGSTLLSSLAATLQPKRTDRAGSELSPTFHRTLKIASAIAGLHSNTSLRVLVLEGPSSLSSRPSCRTLAATAHIPPGTSGAKPTNSSHPSWPLLNFISSGLVRLNFPRFMLMWRCHTIVTQ